MNARFLHIAFDWSGEPKISDIKPAFDHAIDWVRYAPNCWIVWTTSDPERWFERLKPYLDEKDSLFICAIDINIRQGWLSQTIWDWIKKKRT
jgi:hypothetical protein